MKKTLASAVTLAFCISAGHGFAPNVRVVKHEKINSIWGKNTKSKHDISISAVPFDSIVDLYNQALESNPLETKLATGGILALAGDAIAQSQAEGDYDQKRAGAFICFDVLYRAVQCALFPQITTICDGHYLANVLPSVDTSILSTLEQTMANQFVVIPLIYYPVFFSLTGYVQGLTKEQTIERVQTTIVPLLKRNWLFWIPVQYFQFGYVDEPLQIPFLCVVGLAWTFILSLAAGSVSSYDEEEVVTAAATVVGSSQYDYEGLLLDNIDMVGNDREGVVADTLVQTNSTVTV